MKNKIKCQLAFCLLLHTIAAIPQRGVPIPEEIYSQSHEQLSLPESGNEEIDIQLLQEKFTQFRKQPLDINQATADDLHQSGLFNSIQIDHILAWRDQTGAFLALYELQAIPIFTLDEIKQVLPYICLGGGTINLPLKIQIQKAVNQLTLRNALVLEKSNGFSNGKYLGNRFSHYLRYRKSAGNFSTSISMEKDAGEPYLFLPKTCIADFLTFHIKIPWKKINFIVGDYSVSFGQGLILMQDFAPTKSPMITELKRIPKVVRPYSSRGESAFFRGLAVGMPIRKNMSISCFQSARRVDGNTLGDSLHEAQQFSAFQYSGLHRSKSEIDNKKTVFQLATGGSLQFQNRHLNLGWQIVAYHLDKAISPSPLWYRKYEFSGGKLSNSSFNYGYIYHNINVFGETAVSNNGGWGTVNGAILSIDKTIQFSTLYRRYSRNFHTIFSSAFSEVAGNKNESGLCMGINLSPIRKIKIESFIDFWKHPWLRFQTDAPSKGREHFCKITAKPNRTTEFYLQYRYNEKQKSLARSPELGKLGNVSSRQLRIHYSKQATPEFRMQCRAEFFQLLSASHSHGSILFTDLQWKLESLPLAIGARYCIFSTTGYDSRIYSFENTFSGNFALSGIFGKGNRYYINLKYSGIKGISIEWRIAQTQLIDSNTIGSGNDLIPGNRKTEMGIQINIRG